MEPVMVVLGCRPLWSADGRLLGALGRRVRMAREHLGAGWMVVTGGRTWNGVVEADAMRDDLLLAGVPGGSVVRERCSLTTRDNARLSALMLHRLGVGQVTLVTCDWHMARAAAAFREEGLRVDALPVPSPSVSSTVRWVRTAHEWVAARVHLPARTAA